MSRALVTGAAGFVGRHLVRHLVESGRTVYAACRENERGPEGAHVLTLDVTDRRSVEAAFEIAGPDEVYHLAAIASPTGGDATAYLRVNVEGTLYVLLAAQKQAPNARVLAVSSGVVYGECVEKPATEETLPRPLGMYASSKASSDILAGSVRGVQVVRARPFNHTGPGQTPEYLASSLARQVAEIALGRRTPRIELGNLNSCRDFTDVRDVVRAYRILLEKGTPGEAYNVCSGTAVSVAQLAREVLRSRGIDAEIVSVSSRGRAEDIEVLAGNPRKAENLGWVREYSLQRTLADLLAYWEAVLKNEHSAGA